MMKNRATSIRGRSRRSVQLFNQATLRMKRKSMKRSRFLRAIR
jgi:hypothetical protein